MGEFWALVRKRHDIGRVHIIALVRLLTEKLHFVTESTVEECRPNTDDADCPEGDLEPFFFCWAEV